MTKNTTSKTKDSADKRAFNRPDKKQGSEVQEPNTLGREVGQYTGEGVPSLQKK